MGDILLLPREGTRDGDLPPGHLPSMHSLANLLKRAKAQQEAAQEAAQEAPHPPNVAERISSMAARLSESLRTRVNQSRDERRMLQERNERQQILELRMANVSARQ